LQGLDTRNWVSQGSSTSVTCSALPWYKSYQPWVLSCFCLPEWIHNLNLLKFVALFSFNIAVTFFYYTVY
jgi:hypothetical protein